MSDFNHASRWSAPDDDKLPDDIMVLCTRAAELELLVSERRLSSDSCFAYDAMREAAQGFREKAILTCQAYALNNHAVSISPVDAVCIAIEREVSRLKAEHPKQLKSGATVENRGGIDLVQWDDGVVSGYPVTI